MHICKIKYPWTKNTYDFVLEWARCSPKGRLARTLEKPAQVQREYLALADEFCEKYDAIRMSGKPSTNRSIPVPSLF